MVACFATTTTFCSDSELLQKVGDINLSLELYPRLQMLKKRTGGN